MAKKRTMNEYRQTKEHYVSPRKRAFVQEIDKEMENKIDYTDEEMIEEIAHNVTADLSDMIFQAIIEEMENYDEANWSYFINDDNAPVALLDACFEHKSDLHSRIFAAVRAKL